MDNDLNKSDNSHGTAFLLYRPKTLKSNERLFFNEEARRLISHSTFLPETGAASSDLSSICSSWAELLERKLKVGNEGNEDIIGTAFIDLLLSGKRRYMVKGTCVTSCDALTEKQYIFVIERFNHDKVNFSRMFRKWKLNAREQDIVKLLIEGRCNKEIADTLELSIHTIKSYIKLLSRKLGINVRAGLVKLLISETIDLK